METFYCHPDNYDNLKKQLTNLLPKYPDAMHINSQTAAFTFSTMFGLNITVDKNIPKYTQKWIPPKEQFWECEESDKDWCDVIGWGHYEEDMDKLFFIAVNNEDWLKSKPITNDKNRIFTR